jgi:hypothetical protein
MRWRQRYVHEGAVFDAYIDWREESSAVSRAYNSWRDAPLGERAAAFAAYIAALDREQRAGEVYCATFDALARA